MRKIRRRSFTLPPATTGLLTALAIIQSVLQVAMAIASRYVIDAAISNTGTLLQWSLVLSGVVLALVVLHSASGWLSHRVSDECIARMQHRLLRITTQTPPKHLKEYHSGALLSRAMEDVRTVCDGMVRIVPSLLGQIVRLAGALAAVLIICPKVAPVLLIAGASVAIVTAALRRISKSLHRKVREADEQVSSVMQEDLRQLELIQSLQAEEVILQRFDTKLKGSLKAKKSRRVWLVSVNTVIASVSLVGTGALLVWGAVQVAKGGISYGTLTAMVQLLALFRMPLVSISSLWSQLAAADVADERLKELLALADDMHKASVADITVEGVVFENVTFTYPGDVQPVMVDFNAEFSLEQWVCLTGSSGIGKSTLFKLILGLYVPEKGRVYLKTNRGALPCDATSRQLFAYVPQDYALFSGTVAENLLLVAPNATIEDRRNALRLAAADFVWELADGENAQVFENNTGLSMGQMQRLAIARAILMDRPVLLLDECTSALDATTEKRVLDQLRKAGKKVILVTHRPDALDRDNTSFIEI